MPTHPGYHDRYSSAERRQIVVVLDRPDDTFINDLRAAGLRPISEDGKVAVWGRTALLPLAPTLPAETPQTPQAAGPAGLLMTVADAASTLGIGRSSLYELIARGELEVVHVGRSARVPTEALRTFVERLRTEQARSDWRRAAS